MMKRPLQVALLIAVVCGCGQSISTDVVTDYDEQEMEEAIARAQSEVDSFLEELSSPTGTDHSVKVPITDENGEEHFWLSEISFENGEFTGTIDNNPGIVSNVKVGQTWTAKKEEISDWMYMKDGVMQGNYTIRPLLKTLPEEEAAMMRTVLGIP